MNQSAAFIGLGSMGTPMARNLIRGKVPLYVYNRSPEKAADLVKEGAQLIAHPSDAYQKTNIAITMLTNDKALEDVTCGPNGLLETIKPGCIHLSMSSTSPDIARKLEPLHRAKGAYFLAAPVFGRPEVAAAAKLWIALAGDPTAKNQVLPLLKFLGQRVEDFGERPEHANMIKLIGNFMVMSAMESMGEAFFLAEKNGIDKEKLCSFFAETLFACPIYKTYGKLINAEAFEPGLTMVLALKDNNLLRQNASSVDVATPLADLIHDQLEKGIAKGRGDLDWTALTLSAKDKEGH